MALSILTFACSFVACLAFESPFIRLEKMAMTAILGGGGGKRDKPRKEGKPEAQKKPEGNTPAKGIAQPTEGVPPVEDAKQVWSLSSFEVSCQLLTNDLNQVSSIKSALANIGLFDSAPFIDTSHLVAIRGNYQQTRLK